MSQILGFETDYLVLKYVKVLAYLGRHYFHSTTSNNKYRKISPNIEIVVSNYQSQAKLDTQCTRELLIENEAQKHKSVSLGEIKSDEK